MNWDPQSDDDELPDLAVIDDQISNNIPLKSVKTESNNTTFVKTNKLANHTVLLSESKFKTDDDKDSWDGDTLFTNYFTELFGSSKSTSKEKVKNLPKEIKSTNSVCRKAVKTTMSSQIDDKKANSPNDHICDMMNSKMDTPPTFQPPKKKYCETNFNIPKAQDFVDLTDSDSEVPESNSNFIDLTTHKFYLPVKSSLQRKKLSTPKSTTIINNNSLHSKKIRDKYEKNLVNVIEQAEIQMNKKKNIKSISSVNADDLNKGLKGKDETHTFPKIDSPLHNDSSNLIFLKKFLNILRTSCLGNVPQNLTKYLICKHSDKYNFSKKDIICSICCWPHNSIELVFSSDDVLHKMLEKIWYEEKVSSMDNHLIAQFLISFFTKPIQHKVENLIKPLFMHEGDLDEDEEVELGVAETFSDYKPSKLKIGHGHPDAVVETASLSSVEPPEISYTLNIPVDVIESKKLSALQLETITYSAQRFQHFLSDGSRAGFLIGDGAGVGKGRTIAGVIYENYIMEHRKSVWVSVSNDLKFDAERDLNDIGADIKVNYLCKLPYGRIKTINEGVLFCTYSALISQTKRNLKSTLNSRLSQIVDWCGKDFEGCIVFDECHKAKNLIALKGRKPTKTGLAVLELQKRLPKARVFYASATGASEPKDMAYMVRLGIWGSGTPFRFFEDFKSAVDRRGVGAMEIIALNMKLCGSYLARQLSFHGVGFRIEEVPLTDAFKKVYDDSCKLWIKVHRYYEEVEKLTTALTAKMIWAFFWAAHQRFFKYLCVAAKVDRAVQLSKKALDEGYCVVLGIQMTGEASIMKALGKLKEITNFVSAAKSVLEAVIDKFSEEDFENEVLPLRRTKGRSATSRQKSVFALKRSLKKDLFTLGPNLPSSSLDQLIYKLGGPEKVAEMTGRKGRIVKQLNGEIRYVSRCADDEDMDMVNMNEKLKFMEGKKEIAIISEAASSGISLQSDRRVKNTKRRIHITLELPWSADRAIQQFGRTHRSNQVNAPEYVFLISDLAGERRFASIVAKRLESLGALTHGDRRSTNTRDLSCFHIDNKYGRLALNSTFSAINGSITPLVQLPPDYVGDFFLDVSKALTNVGMTSVSEETGNFYVAKGEGRNVQRFLNRLLGLPVDLQNRLFQYFIDTHDAIVQEEKRLGKYDLGILDLGIGGQSCQPVRRTKWIVEHTTGQSEIVLHTVLVDRGISWNEAIKKFNDCIKEDNEGFYVARSDVGGKKNVVLALLHTAAPNQFLDKRSQSYLIFRPNSGQGKPMKYADLMRKYCKVHPDLANRHWKMLFQHTEKKCLHSYWNGYCIAASESRDCNFGMRTLSYFILCGAVVTVWTTIEKTFVMAPTLHSRIQVIRLKTKDGKKLVGIRIPKGLVDSLRHNLSEELSRLDAECDLREKSSSAESQFRNIPQSSNKFAPRSNSLSKKKNCFTRRPPQKRKLGERSSKYRGGPDPKKTKFEIEILPDKIPEDEDENEITILNAELNRVDQLKNKCEEIIDLSETKSVIEMEKQRGTYKYDSELIDEVEEVKEDMVDKESEMNIVAKQDGIFSTDSTIGISFKEHSLEDTSKKLTESPPKTTTDLSNVKNNSILHSSSPNLAPHAEEIKNLSPCIQDMNVESEESSEFSRKTRIKSDDESHNCNYKKQSRRKIDLDGHFSVLLEVVENENLETNGGKGEEIANSMHSKEVELNEKFKVKFEIMKNEDKNSEDTEANIHTKAAEGTFDKENQERPYSNANALDLDDLDCLASMKNDLREVTSALGINQPDDPYTSPQQNAIKSLQSEIKLLKQLFLGPRRRRSILKPKPS